jgi:hypothetical protein
MEAVSGLRGPRGMKLLVLLDPVSFGCILCSYSHIHTLLLFPPNQTNHTNSLDSQQLNFYSFRKIKYADTIRIDPEMEKETANYWRFRHEKFQRGKPQLLTEIKRMNGQKTLTTATSNANATPNSVTSSSAKTVVTVSKDEEKGVKSEVQVLKKKIEEMTKNIDNLTAMVHKVSLKQDVPAAFGQQPAEDAAGNKRKKVGVAPVPEDENIRPDEMLSRPDEMLSRPDEMLSGMDFEEMDIAVPEIPSPMRLSPETSATSQLTRISEISDNEFVDQLFTAFKEEEVEEVFKLDAPLEATLLPLPPVAVREPEPEVDKNMDQPDPELMRRLGDALMLLPRETQEMIVDRLIAAVTSADSLEIVTQAAASLKQEAPTKVVTIKLPPSAIPQSPAEQQEATLPLAAATLAALLHHYSAQLKGKTPRSMQQTIPVIPVHA